MIIAGQLHPGERIVESRVARQLGVGQPTVREALVALEHQGLVVRKANQGCVVTTLTRAEICEILRIRAELEVLAVELAVENASDAGVRELIARARDLKKTPGLRISRRFSRAIFASIRLSGKSREILSSYGFFRRSSCRCWRSCSSGMSVATPRLTWRLQGKLTSR